VVLRVIKVRGRVVRDMHYNPRGGFKFVIKAARLSGFDSEFGRVVARIAKQDDGILASCGNLGHRNDYMSIQDVEAARERVVCVLDTVLGEHHHTLVVRDMRRGVIDVPRDIVMLADDPDGASVRISDRGYIDVPGLEGYRCTEYECQEGE